MMFLKSIQLLIGAVFLHSWAGYMDISLKFASFLQNAVRRPSPIKQVLRKHHCRNVENWESKMATKECEEVHIKVPWGHVAGKWWGIKSTRPILGIHGWQDNSGTFDTLAQVLPDHIGFLAIDLPGHGLSSRLPDGIDYSLVNYIYVIRQVMKHHDWDKLSIIGHSLSSSLGFMFSALFPDKIDMMIGFDMLKPLVRPPNKMAEMLTKHMESFILANERNMGNTEPPSYSYEECTERFYLGLDKSVDRNKCFHIMDRNLKQSTQNPNKYYFNRDNRLKYGFNMISQPLCIELAQKIMSTPYLFVKAKGSPYFEDETNFWDIFDILKKNPNFEFHEIEGSHHLHLNEPKKVEDIIRKFINKYRPASTS